jgi:sterol desaturase/sphingolipid hydroxylase (fatty acid hydroxylase superfamily)
MQITDQDLVLIRIFYAGMFIGVLGFLAQWEDGAPLSRFDDGRAKWQHRWRNMAMLFWVVVVADYLIGQGVCHARDFLAQPPVSLLHGSALPLALQLALGLLASDLMDYGLHVASHRWRWFWRLHAVHHSDTHLDATTAQRFHPIETSIYIVAKLGLYVVLGLPFWIEGVRAIFFNSLLFIQHANIAYPRCVERIGWLLVTPGMHRIHHALDRVRQDSNYGLIFPFWDRLFGTFRAQEKDMIRQVGLTGYQGEDWQTVGGMLAMPFRQLKPRDQGL